MSSVTSGSTKELPYLSLDFAFAIVLRTGWGIISKVGETQSTTATAVSSPDTYELDIMTISRVGLSGACSGGSTFNQIQKYERLHKASYLPLFILLCTLSLLHLETG